MMSGRRLALAFIAATAGGTAQAQSYLPAGAQIVPRDEIQGLFAGGGVLCSYPDSVAGACGDVSYVDKDRADRFQIINVYAEGAGVLGAYIFDHIWQGDRFCDASARPVVFFGRANVAQPVFYYDLSGFDKDFAEVTSANDLITGDGAAVCYEMYRLQGRPDIWYEVGFFNAELSREAVAYSVIPTRPVTTGTQLTLP